MNDIVAGIIIAAVVVTVIAICAHCCLLVYADADTEKWPGLQATPEQIAALENRT